MSELWAPALTLACHSYTRRLLGVVEERVSRPGGPSVKEQENTALVSNLDLTGTPLRISLSGLGGKECSDCLHSVYVEDVGLPSPLLAEVPPLRGPQPQPPRAARGPSRTPPPTSHPSFFRPLTNAIRDHLRGYYVADAADHAWTIAMATGSTPLPPRSQPLRHSGGGLNVAARHVLPALYLHHVTYTSKTNSSWPRKQQPRRQKRGRTRHQRR